MVQPNGWLNERDAAPSVTRILDAAAEVFAELGFAGARVDEIARRAGVNKAMLYYHVGSKGELYAAVVRRSLAMVRREMEAAVRPEDPPVKRLRSVIATMVRMVRTIPHHSRIVLQEIASGGQHLPEELLREICGVVGNLLRTLEDGAARGVFRRVDPILVHMMLVGSITVATATQPLRARALELGMPVPPLESEDELTDFLYEVLLGGLLRAEED